MTAKRNKAGAANQQLIKSTNLSLVFGLIHQHEPISRAKLARQSGLSPTTVSALVDELISQEMVEEIGVANTTLSGRKPVMLQICPSGGYVIGIELSANGFSAGLYDLKGALVRERAGKKTCDLIPALEEMVGCDLGIEKILGIAVGIPAIIDKREMRVISSTLVSPEECHRVFASVKERFPTVRVQMGNESSFCAYIEKAALGDTVKSLVYVEVNDGIGAGIVLDNRIFTGAFGNAGELGHVSVDLNGPECLCGNRGCLETLASVPALISRVEKQCGHSEYYKNGVTLSNITRALSEKDVDTTDALRETCRILAIGLNNMINILNPEALVLGGMMAKLGRVFLNLLREELAKISFAPNIENISISTSKVSGNAACRGAARYLLDGIFHSSEFWID